MKALTLTQPWATLVSLEAKRIETRSWKTNYRGELAIHAAAGFPGWAKSTCMKAVFAEGLRVSFPEHGEMFPLAPPLPSGRQYLAPEWLPIGSVVAICTLVDIIPTVTEQDALYCISRSYPNGLCMPPDEPEQSFGDYSPGRFAWILEDIRPLGNPIPAKGALSVWEWDEEGLHK